VYFLYRFAEISASVFGSNNGKREHLTQPTCLSGVPRAWRFTKNSRRSPLDTNVSISTIAQLFAFTLLM
jgi:hypothetical protein